MKRFGKRRKSHPFSLLDETKNIIDKWRIPNEWEEAALDEAAGFGAKWFEDNVCDRLDFSSQDFVTIDGEDARDFDDSICCHQVQEGFVLWVAIADVASYVLPDTKLDQQARLRGNSAYFPRTTIPMLPEVLSNQWCSLQPHQKRLVIACKITISMQGEVKDFSFSKAIIQSRARLTYSQVDALFQKKPSDIDGRIKEMLKCAHKLMLVLRENSRKRGALDLNIPAFNFFDSIEKATDFPIQVRHTIAHRMIEEFMILANHCCAAFLFQNKIRNLERSHPVLEPGSLDLFRNFLRQFGVLEWDAKDLSLQGLVDKAVAAFPQQRAFISVQVLRILQRACYIPVYRKPQGHYGLALDIYTHFTSPIRRYPDLIVHRAIAKVLGLPCGKIYSKKQLKEFGEYCTFTEKRSEDAGRDLDAFLSCYYLTNRVGKVFSGKVMTVTHFGLFVAMENLGCEGLLHVSRLKRGYYNFDEERCALIADSPKGSAYFLGDSVKVRIIDIDLEKRRISLAEVLASDT